MFSQNLAGNVSICNAMNAVAAGTSDNQDGNILDLAGYDSVVIVLLLGTVTSTAVGTLTAMVSDDSGLAGATTIAGPTSIVLTGDSGKVMVLDLKRLKNRYLRARLVRATANIVIQGAIAVLYDSHGPLPLTLPGDVVKSQTFETPASS